MKNQKKFPKATVTRLMLSLALDLVMKLRRQLFQCTSRSTMWEYRARRAERALFARAWMKHPVGSAQGDLLVIKWLARAAADLKRKK